MDSDLSDPVRLGRMLQATGLFDPTWYREHYPDVDQVGRGAGRGTGLDPLTHFLRYGLLLGRRPGPGFEPDFYASDYPDVPQSGLVPLQHYLLYGAAEGRFPTAAAAARHRGLVRVQQLQALLWGGLAASAEAELSALLNDPEAAQEVRLAAGVLLATWAAFTERPALARRILESQESLPAALARSARRLIPLAMLYQEDGRREAAARALEEIRPEEQDSHRVLALANLDEGQARLDRINGIYSALDLATLALRDPDQPLSLANLAAPAGPAPDRGKVSVILPAFQAEAQIGTALAGLQAQSHENLEILVVDDASTDGTADLVADLAAQDPRIVLLRQRRNGGAYAARNLGLARASGDFITTHDADDWSHSQKIALQVAELTGAPEVMGVITHWSRVRPDLAITTNWRLSAQLTQWSHSSFLFRRAVAERLGGWDAVRVSGDTDYIWRVQAAYGAQAVRRILPAVPLAFAADAAGSLTRASLTHVRSTYGGLRHYYREICRYWLARAPGGLSPEQQAAKWAMLPAAILPGQDGSDRVALLLRGDCCDPDVLARMSDLARATAPERVALSHRPDPGFTDRQFGYAMEFPAAFFEVLQQENVILACPEEAVQAQARRDL
ncbi:glycosyltransferase family A protein [Maritimibacter alkaliphilus]|uniref:glycosyltransferase family A protein n=1 Tax=Maritimibacter alkaliphilus TaxID=404236 RepID=UPI001C955415|nr:glycosyltransferase family A protein [Maritimibacter alkaliphilus]MBY6092917.1 glycosyltransferase family 2 protein [Maritimibacter alkaliphilus]